MADTNHRTPATSDINAPCALDRKLTLKNHVFGLPGNYANGVITTIEGVDTPGEGIPFRDVCFNRASGSLSQSDHAGMNPTI
jgi:hypothetical protein